MIFAQEDSRAGLPPDALEPPAWPRSSELYPVPDPFSVNRYDAVHAIALIRRAGMVVRVDGDYRETIGVRTVSARKVEPMEDMPPRHIERYELLLNGEPLQWDELYLEYGGRLVNLQLLFTYRNQRPVPDVPFVLE